MDSAAATVTVIAASPEPETAVADEGQPPRPQLYVGRMLADMNPWVQWAARVGIRQIDNPPHLTVCHSRAMVDVPADTEAVTIDPSDFVRIDRFGKFLVLVLHSPHLEARHATYLAAGATSDYEPYVPHLTITADEKVGTDIPLPGFPITLGPEIQGPASRNVFAAY